MTKTEQIREQLWIDVMEDYVFLLKMTPFAKDEAKNMDECRKQLDKIVAWVEQKLEEQEQELVEEIGKLYKESDELNWSVNKTLDTVLSIIKR